MLVKRFVLLYTNFMTLEGKIAQILVNTRKMIAIAESCTGGHLSNRLTNIPGSSKFFKLGIVTYSNAAKTKLLGVPARLIKKSGAVSKEAASAMALGIRQKAGTDFGIGISGIAGPSGGTKAKPVGLVFVAVAGAKDFICARCYFKGNRLKIKSQAAEQALIFLLDFLS